MDEQERTAIGDSFFKVLAIAYRHGALEKYLKISNKAKAEAARELGMGTGDYTNAMNDLDLEVFQRYEAKLERIVPYLDLLASDMLWSGASRLLDNQLVQKFIWEESKKKVTGEANVTPEKETVIAMISEIIQPIGNTREQKARVAKMMEAVQTLLWPESKSGSKETV